MEIDDWISVNDNLPDISVTWEESIKRKIPQNKVMIYAPTTLGVDTGYYWGTALDSPLKGWSIMGVTHWKPLSTPPSKKSN